MLNPYAFFDVLAICVQLSRVIGRITESEIHLLGYLSCLLSLYKKRPVAEWGYYFSGTKFGEPFSFDISKAIENLCNGGQLIRLDNMIEVTEQGIDYYEKLKKFSQNSERSAFLEGACSSLLVLSITQVREALRYEPESNHVRKISVSRLLLDNPLNGELYDHLEALSHSIGVEIKDLMSPAVVWLTYLLETSKMHK